LSKSTSVDYDGLQPRQPGEHPYRAADADGKEQREGGVMAKKKTPKNVEWIVTGRVVLDGATCIVHAETRQEAIAKATSGQYIGEIEWDGASLTDFSARRAEANIDYE
jgi:hypothetical protein